MLLRQHHRGCCLMSPASQLLLLLLTAATTPAVVLARDALSHVEDGPQQEHASSTMIDDRGSDDATSDTALNLVDAFTSETSTAIDAASAGIWYPTGGGSSCSPSFENLTLSSTGDSKNFGIFWIPSSDIKICGYHYRITAENMWTSGILSQNSSDNFTFLENIQPCTAYNITVETIKTSNNAVLFADSKVEDFLNEEGDRVTNLTYLSSTNSIYLSWTPSNHSLTCNISYEITLNSYQKYGVVPYFRFETSTKHLIKNLRSCTYYNVTVRPSDMLANLYDEGDDQNMHIIGTLPGSVRDLKLDYNTLKWRPPENKECLKGYKVSYQSFNIITSYEYYVSNRSLICVSIEVTTVPKMGNKIGNSARILKPGPINKLTTIPTDSTLHINWKTTCTNVHMDYIIQLNNFDARLVNGTSYKFDNLKPCVSYNISIKAKSKTGHLGDVKTFLETTLPPKNIKPINILHVEIIKNYLFVTWEPPDDEKYCNLFYNISILDDKNKIFYQNRTQSLKDVINFKKAEDCILYKIKIVSTLNNSVSQPTVRTVEAMKVPEKVSNLNIEETNNQSIISWKPPNNHECVSKYLVSSKYFNETTDELRLPVNRSLECVEVNVTVLSFHNNLGLPQTIIKPPNVQKTSGRFLKNNSLVVEWETSSNDTCVDVYEVKINGTYDSTKQRSYTFSNVKPCAVYEIKLNSHSKTEEIGVEDVSIINTPLPTSLNPISNLEVHIIPEKSVQFRWIPPTNANACPLTYELELHNGSGSLLEASTNRTEYTKEATNLVYCMQYKFQVTAVIGTIRSRPIETSFQIFAVRAAPKCQVTKRELDQTTLRCDFEDLQKNVCPINTLTVICNSDNSTKSVSREIKNNESPIEVIIPGLQGYSNLSCSWSVSSGKNESRSSDFVPFQGVPDAPILQPITNFSQKIHWNPPKNVPGSLQNYMLTVTDLGPTYFEPKECTRGQRIFYYTANSTSTEYLFTNASPSHKYKIVVNASTISGYGPYSNMVEVVTSNGIPEGTRNTNFNNTNNKNTIEVYNESVSIMWLYPCRANGNVSHFQVHVIGKSAVNDYVANHEINKTLKVNEPITSLEYNCYIDDLKPAFNYHMFISVINENNLSSTPDELEFNSSEGYPDAPILREVQGTYDTLLIKWEQPKRKNGILQNYTITVKDKGPSYWIPSECNSYNEKQYEFLVLPSFNNYTFRNGSPFHNYSVHVTASTKVGLSYSSNEIKNHTLEKVPEEVRNPIVNISDEIQNDECGIIGYLEFSYPCNTYGKFKQFYIKLEGINEENKKYSEKIFYETESENKYKCPLDLQYATNYNLSIQVETEKFKSLGISKSFNTRSGIPPKPNSTNPLQQLDTFRPVFSFRKDLFSNANGKILYYAVIVGVEGFEEKSTFGCWNKTWPSIQTNLTASDDELAPYQATKDYWNPFTNNQINFTVMLEDNSNFEVNKPLKTETKYNIKVRAFTEYGYRDTIVVEFELKGQTDLGLILGVTFGIFGTSVILVIIYIIYKKRQHWYLIDVLKCYQRDNGQSFRNKVKESIKPFPLMPIPVCISKFSQYYDELKNNNEKLKQEFALLGNKSSEITLICDDALLPDNKKKNRYTNILPYDQSRVKLLDHEDKSGGDYINASYIKGYSGDKEYIATQGPLEHTCLDFWKMVIQENSSLIVMVAQFVETNKEKCFKYFPNVHENMELENGIGIRCCTELDFKTHIIRTFLVQKDAQQWTITHLQFTDWPDFGCPKGTDIILEFCQLMREHAERNCDPIIVHCSAGVGRTGTLIALDILLQAKNNKQDINIFDTVLNLRYDRKNMVQTEKQYLFIHNCVDNAIKNPVSLKYVISKDPIYENLDEIEKKVASDCDIANYIQESKF